MGKHQMVIDIGAGNTKISVFRRKKDANCNSKLKQN